ncbi:MAG: YebG family protein [Desulfobacteraceae bacterium]|nr:YebG family protein [Desulfobacteraceae bacterium]
MAVITRFIVVRNGVELDKIFEVKKEAEAYDKMLDAAENLAKFIRESDIEVDIDQKTIDELSVFLAKNAPQVNHILKGVKPLSPSPEKSGAPKKPEPVKEPVKEQVSDKGKTQKKKRESRLKGK